ncbi:MAG: hypothetical protein ACI9R3_004607 [Verrucomicrobiales bacterium]|jgi:hypothetical protein
MMPHFFRSALFGCLALLAGIPAVFGHTMDTNLYVQVHLYEDKMVCEIDVGSFQFPPLQEVQFARPDTHPTMEEKREELEGFFREQCPVEIDGIIVQPVLTSLKFEDFETAAHLMTEMDIVYVGLKLEYSLKRPPKRIGMKWGFFAQPEEGEESFPGAPDDPAVVGDGLAHNPQEVVADFIIHGDPDEYDLVYFSPEEPEYIWHRPAPELSSEALAELTAVRKGSAGSSGNMLRYGLFAVGGIIAAFGLIVSLGKKGSKLKSAVLLGAGGAVCFAGGALSNSGSGALSEKEAVDTFKALQANIYSAFDHNTEDEIYDALAQSVDGALLDHVYNDVFESLILRSEGGVMATVQKVETLQAEVTATPDASSDSYVIDCIWRVHGSVKHFKHIHRRLNEYHASYEMAPRGGTWKIIKSIETKRERLDGQVAGSSAGGVLPPAQDQAVDVESFQAPAGDLPPIQIDDDLNLPGILDGNTMEE